MLCLCVFNMHFNNVLIRIHRHKFFSRVHEDEKWLIKWWRNCTWKVCDHTFICVYVFMNYNSYKHATCTEQSFNPESSEQWNITLTCITQWHARVAKNKVCLCVSLIPLSKWKSCACIMSYAWLFLINSRNNSRDQNCRKQNTQWADNNMSARVR